MHTTDKRRCQCGGCDKPAHVALGVSGQLACMDHWRNERFVPAKSSAAATEINHIRAAWVVDPDYETGRRLHAGATIEDARKFAQAIGGILVEVPR